MTIIEYGDKMSFFGDRVNGVKETIGKGLETVSKSRICLFRLLPKAAIVRHGLEQKPANIRTMVFEGCAYDLPDPDERKTPKHQWLILR